jgi:hypothetical protein
MNLIAFLLSAIVGLTPKAAMPQAADEHADIYAIYSLMMTNPPTSHGPSTDEVYLIADTTRPVRPVEPCVRVPSQYEMAYQEILDEYHRRKDKPVKLERALNIAKPYELLNADDADKYVAIHSGYLRIPDPNPKELLRKSTDLFYLGDVYFNQSHTLALTAISTYCGGLCGSMNWKLFEKSSTGQWEGRPWVGCSGVARIEQRPSKRPDPA